MTLEEYKNKIRRLIATGSQEIILNGSADHAAAIIEGMLAAANEKVNILSRRFHPSVFASEDLIDRAMQFAASPDAKLRILVETNDCAVFENHPFYNRAAGNSNIEFKYLKPAFSDIISSNFATMDDRAFRFEEDKSKPLAVAGFNNPKNVASLDKLFNSAWLLADDLVCDLAEV